MKQKQGRFSPPVTVGTIALGALVCLISFGFFMLSGGNLGAALVPIIGIGVVVALFALPLRVTFLAFVTLMMLLSNSQMGPMMGMWHGPLEIVGRLFRAQLDSITGIGVLNVTLAELGIWTFAFIVILRTVFHNNIDKHLSQPASRPLKTAVFIAMGTIVLWAAIGFLRGGSIQHIMFQCRDLFTFQLCIIVSMRAFKDEKIFPLMGKLLVIICVIRILEAAYFYFAIAIPQGLLPDMKYITTHTDSFLFIGAIALLILEVLEKPGFKIKRNLFIYGGIVMWGVVVNDRRVAFISLALCIMLIYFFLSPGLKKKIKGTLLKLLPLIIIYVGIGMHSKSPVFMPVQTFVSVSDENDSSNVARKVENMNLAYTVEQNPVFGSGFGAPYLELIPAVRLHAAFADDMMYMPHNHFLWLAYLLGGVGLFLLWLPLLVGCYLAFRVHKVAQNANQRIICLWAVCSVIIYLTQTYADMGSLMLKGQLMISVAFAAVANLSKQLDVV